MPKAVPDKRVFDVRVTLASADASVWRLISVSADAKLSEFYRTVQGAFGWTEYLMQPRLRIEGAFYAGGSGTRSLLRNILSDGNEGALVLTQPMAESYFLDIVVERSYIVSTRRHHPKVLDGAGPDARSRTFSIESATSEARDVARSMTQGSRNEISFERPPSPIRGTREQGFFASLVAGPLMTPSEWMPRLLADQDEVLATPERARATVDGMMARYNRVVADIGRGSLREDEILMEWCQGFMCGIELRSDEWRTAYNEDRALFDALQPIVEGAREYPADGRAVLAGLFVIHEYWRKRNPIPETPVRRSQPRISMNDPCPCGGGKKYKHCCSPLRAV